MVAQSRQSAVAPYPAVGSATLFGRELAHRALGLGATWCGAVDGRRGSGRLTRRATLGAAQRQFCRPCAGAGKPVLAVAELSDSQTVSRAGACVGAKARRRGNARNGRDVSHVRTGPLCGRDGRRRLPRQMVANLGFGGRHTRRTIARGHRAVCVACGRTRRGARDRLQRDADRRRVDGAF